MPEPSVSLRPPRNRWTRRYLRRRPPPVPPGWRPGPPDFVGVGAQRSGSSWWFRAALDSHPNVVRVDDGLKELHFFDRFWHGRVPHDLAARYERFFPRPEGAIAGEWTPRYMYDHWSMRLLHGVAPKARILIILRDPIERYRSGLEAWQRSHLFLGRRLDEIAGAVSRSTYSGQLHSVFALYPRDQVLILQYEKCRAEPASEMKRTWDFLGLDPELGPQEGPPEAARAPRPKPELPEGFRDDLVARLRPDVETVAQLCPEVDLTLWPAFE